MCKYIVKLIHCPSCKAINTIIDGSNGTFEPGCIANFHDRCPMGVLKLKSNFWKLSELEHILCFACITDKDPNTLEVANGDGIVAPLNSGSVEDINRMPESPNNQLQRAHLEDAKNIRKNMSTSSINDASGPVEELSVNSNDLALFGSPAFDSLPAYTSTKVAADLRTQTIGSTGQTKLGKRRAQRAEIEKSLSEWLHSNPFPCSHKSPY